MTDHDPDRDRARGIDRKMFDGQPEDRYERGALELAPLVVTRNGVPLADQSAGVREFLDRCRIAAARPGERTRPLRFLLEGITVHVDEGKGKDSVWAAELRWDDEDGCFVFDTNGPGNYDFAPCDLEELARIMRTLQRELTP